MLKKIAVLTALLLFVSSGRLSAQPPFEATAEPSAEFHIDQGKVSSEVSAETLKSHPDYESWAPGRIGAPRVRRFLGITGKGVRVGIIDTGIMDQHDDLRGKVAAWRDFMADPSPSPIDAIGHGTHVAGIIAGGPRCGVAPDVSLIVARVFDPPRATTPEMIIRALEWMADPDGNPATHDAPHIVNCSWGNDINADETLRPAIKALESKGILVVTEVSSRGGAGCGSPANYGEVLAAGGLTRSDGISYLSSWGVSPLTLTRKPDLAAPGESIFSCWKNGGYTMKDGPSCAAALVTGAAALAQSAALLRTGRPLPLARLKAIILETADKPDNPYVGERAGKGVVDAWEAVALAGELSTLELRVLAPSRWEKCETSVIMSLPELAMNFSCPSVPLTGDSQGWVSRSFQLKPGSWTLSAASFGWVAGSLDASVTGSRARDALELTQSPTAELRFNVIQPPTEIPEWVDIIFEPIQNDPGLPWAVWRLESLPENLPVPTGFWRVTVLSQGCYPIVNEFQVLAEGHNQEMTLSFQPLPPVLWVDDDRLTPCSEPVEKALRLLGVKYFHYEYDPNCPEAAKPDARFMGQFQKVLWTMGNGLWNVPAPRDLEAMAGYLEQGGCLAVSGQDLCWSLGRNSLFRKIFQAGLKHDDGLVRQVEAAPDSPFGTIDFSIDAQGKWQTQFSPDSIYPLPMANRTVTLLRYRPEGNFVPGDAAIGVEAPGSRAVILAFGLEGISSENSLRQLLGKTLEWLDMSRSKLFADYLRYQFEDERNGEKAEKLIQRIVRDANSEELASMLRFIEERKFQSRTSELIRAIHQATMWE